MDEFENRPLLIYDGECEFCVKWAHKFKVMAGKYITFIPLQNLPVNYEWQKLHLLALMLVSVIFVPGFVFLIILIIL